MQSEQRKELPRSQRECRILGASMREAHAMASGLLELVLSSLSAKEIEIDDLRSSECGSRGDSLGHSTQPNHGWLLRPVPRLLPAKHGAWLKAEAAGCPADTMGLCGCLEIAPRHAVQDESLGRKPSMRAGASAKRIPPGASKARRVREGVSCGKGQFKGYLSGMGRARNGRAGRTAVPEASADGPVF
jgi:hypothetical protein